MVSTTQNSAVLALPIPGYEALPVGYESVGNDFTGLLILIEHEVQKRLP